MRLVAGPEVHGLEHGGEDPARDVGQLIRSIPGAGRSPPAPVVRVETRMVHAGRMLQNVARTEGRGG